MTLTCNLTFVVRSSNGQKESVVFVKRGIKQAYLIHGLHEKTHGQLTGEEFEDYVDRLGSQGFIQLQDPQITAGGDRPPKYFMVLGADRDWVTEEIIVVNQFSSSPELSTLSASMDMNALGQSLLVDHWGKTKKYLDKNRLNWQISIGSNHVDVRDPGAIEHVMVPRRFAGARKLKPGLDGDRDMEVTLYKRQSVMTEMLDYICSASSRSMVFHREDRQRHFSARALVELGLPSGTMRCDASSILWQGLLQESVRGIMTAQCRLHTDDNNDRTATHGEDANFCYSEVITVRYPMRSRPTQGILAMNQYNKHINAVISAKEERTNAVVNDVKQYLRRSGWSGVINESSAWTSQVLNIRQSRNWSEHHKVSAYQSMPGKNIYYSFYVHVIFDEVMRVYGWNKYVICECLYCMSLTPSAVGWRKGLRYALKARHNGKNLITNFIEEMVYKHGTVAHSFHYRCRRRCSSKGLRGRHQLFVSILNMLKIFEYASHGDSVSERVYRDMASDPLKRRAGMRGLYGVRDLHAYEITNCATKTGLVKNVRHIRNVGVAKGTATGERLRARGFDTDAHRRELMDTLCQELDCDSQTVENLLCETLKSADRTVRVNRGEVDVVAEGQSYYEVVGDKLLVITCEGERRLIEFDDITKERNGEEYRPKWRWWEMNPDYPELLLGRNQDIILSEQSKPLMAYLNGSNRV